MLSRLGSPSTLRVEDTSEISSSSTVLIMSALGDDEPENPIDTIARDIEALKLKVVLGPTNVDYGENTLEIHLFSNRVG